MKNISIIIIKANKCELFITNYKRIIKTNKSLKELSYFYLITLHLLIHIQHSIRVLGITSFIPIFSC